MRLQIISESNRRIPRRRIRHLVEIIEEDEDPPDSQLNIIFTRDRRLAQLNQDYRNRTGPTDVLSFTIDDTSGDDAVMGEIYISTDTAARNAEQYGATFTDEILRLCCHGFLHILGYDHMKSNDQKVMFARERVYLERERSC
ncbi:MAG: rRNA maturation RNase YbeY [candidate division Zixibacteria bacterium]|nr:rRNA maturation RNase YbeY [candidate division Zixibacteria bacterium]